ncbi:MAG: hypothetical protein NTX05_08890 [Fusobacteria bacterium]|nr:hypothetical protein [Fusobacteriota bacterium]
MELFEELYIIKTEEQTVEKFIPFKEGGVLYWYNATVLKAYLPYRLRRGVIRHLIKIGAYEIFVADLESEFMISVNKLSLLNKFIEIEKVKCFTQALF